MRHPRLPRAAGLLLRSLLPRAERAETIDEMAREHARRAANGGHLGAGLWLWRQVLGSLPHLLRRTLWRGRTGFEPESSRLEPGGPGVESWIVDGRYALRRLVKRPMYTALAVVTLAMGVGGTAAAYGIVRSLVLDPLPYADEGNLAVWWKPFNWSEEEHVYLREGVPGFERVAIYRIEELTMRRDDGPTAVVHGVSASAELFDVLGVRPALGIGFQPGDDAAGAAPHVVISHGLWRELGGSRELLGETLTLDGVARTVVGVMPAGFWFPDPTIRAWVPEPIDPANGAGNYAVIGRIAAGHTMGSMTTPLARLTTSLRERFEYVEGWDNSRDAVLTPVREYLIGPVRPALLATLAAMGSILLMACANVAALMLGQVDGRTGELAVRTALGAGRGRLIQQLVVEAVVVGVLAGMAGAGLAAAVFPVLVGALPLGALAGRAGLDWTVFGATIALGVAASLAVALVPTVSILRGNLRTVLSGARTGGIVVRGGRIESALVVAEVALAVVIAAGAALLIRSVSKLAAIDPGVETSGVAVVDVTLPAGLEIADQQRTVMEITRELAALPGAAAAGAAQKLPLRGSGNNWGFAIPSRPETDGVWTAFRVVTPGYFAAAGIDLRQGRLFEEADRLNDQPLVIINEAMAERFFPGEDPIGRMISTGFEADERIVGIVETAAEAELTAEPHPARYMLYDHVPTSMEIHSFVIRAHRATEVPVLLDAARERIAAVAPGAAIRETSTMEHVFAQAVGPALQIRTLLSLLAGLALVLGAVGVYGVVSHYVSRRKRELGIRMALGLRPARVVAGVVVRGGRLVAAGAVIGVIAAVILGRVLESFLFGITAADPVALAAAAGILAAAGAAAALLPASRAARVSPASILKDE